MFVSSASTVHTALSETVELGSQVVCVVSSASTVHIALSETVE